MIQSKLAVKIVTTIHTKKKQLIIDNERKDKYDTIPDQIRDTGKKIHPTRTAKGNKKRKKKVHHRSHISSGESRKNSKDKEIAGATFGMQTIADRFGDGWHKSTLDIFGVQRITALFGDAVT